jgi:hypothetical protein
MNRTPHKWPASLLILLVLGAASAVSCDNGATLSNAGSALEAEGAALTGPNNPGNPYAWVGVQHNAAVHFALSELSRIRNLRNLPEAAVPNLIESRTLRYLATQGITASPDVLQAGMAAVPVRGRISPSVLDYVAQGDVSTEAAQYVDQIVAWTQDDAIPLSDLYVRLAALENEAASRLNPSESEIVLSLSAVAASSATYWEQNGDAWVDQYLGGKLIEPLSTGGFTAMGRINWRMVAGHDVLGGFSGAIAAAATGAGVIAGALGGAACGSTISAVGQLLLM